jgi:hypothetical protein
MIYEIRTYTLTTGAAGEVEERTAESIAAWGNDSPLVGFFHTETGPLNEVVHVWRFADLAERAAVRARALEDPRWPPATGHLILNQQTEIVTPFPFAPEWTPGADGPVYELRQYTFRPGTLPAIMQSWEAALPARLELSRPVLLGNVEIGPSVNSFVHLWPYRSLDERADIRSAAVAAGIWPPAGGRDYYLQQTSKILLPASFSPAQ